MISSGRLLVAGMLTLFLVVAGCAGGETQTKADGQAPSADAQPEGPPSECQTAETRPCYTGSIGCTPASGGYQCTGSCQAGTESCGVDGKWSGVCTDEVLPQDETCNNLDDDCDGRTDEDLNRACYTGQTGCTPQGETFSCKGLCQPGSEICVAGQWGACNGEVLPSAAEKCDGKDDNCDGQVDEGCECLPGTTQPCYSGLPATKGVGPCKEGQQACDTEGKLGPCVGEVVPKAETCDGTDESCTGVADDGLTAPACTLAVGVCTGATKTCGGASGWVDCTTADYQAISADYEPVETKCDNKDNDCNGQVDENLSRVCYSGTTGCTLVGSTYQCVGQCKGGTQACAAGLWGSCGGEVTPQVELCNWQDDDCDGVIDNHGACHYSGWTAATLPVGATRVAFVDARVGVAIGSVGQLWRSIDGGSSWQTVTSPTTQTLQGVATLPSGLVVAVGTGGVILRSVDAGESFAAISTPSGQTLYGVSIATNGDVVAVGASGTVLRSTDHATTFLAVTSGTTSTLHAVAYRENSLSYVVAVGSAGTIRRSTDGGASWTAATSGSTATLYGVAFWSGTLVAAGSSGTILRSNDSGVGWAAVQGTGATGTLRSVLVAGTETFIVGGSGSSFYLSVDDGQSFFARPIGVGGTFDRLALRSPTALYATGPGVAAVGEGPVAFVRSADSGTLRGVAYDNRYGGSAALAAGSSGLLLRSADEGSSWTRVHAPTTATLYGVTLLDQTALAVGSGGTALRSTDQGRSWAVVDVGVTASLYGVALGGASAGPVVALAVGSSGTLRRSVDGGVSWTGVTLPGSPSTLYAVSFKDDTAVVVGSSGYAARSTNAGASWTQISTGVTNTLYSVYMYSVSGTTVAVGSTGTILRSTNGGASFSAVSSGVTNTLYGVGNGLGSYVVVVGSSGTVLRSSDSGATFAAAPAPGGTTLYAAFRNYGTNRVLIAGSSAYLALSTNYGANFAYARAPGFSLRAVTALPGSKHVAVGWYGLVASTADFGQTLTLGATGDNDDLYTVAYEPFAKVLAAAGQGGSVYRSIDDGLSWSVGTSSTTYALYGLAAPSSGVFRAVGSLGTIVGSSNGGTSYSGLTSPTTSTLENVTCLQGTCLAVGLSGRLLRSTNGGSSWTQINMPVSSSLYGVAFGLTTSAVAVGASGTALYSGDGGLTWQQGTTPFTSTLYGVTALDSQRYLAVDSSGRVIATADGGQNWTVHSPPLGMTLYGIDVSAVSGGLIVGSSGLIGSYTP